MNYYEHHIGDYLAAAAHLTLLEHGCYLRLLHVYYRDEAPIAAADACRKVGARSDEERAAVAAILAEFFTLDGEVYRHARCDREIERYRSKQEKAKASAAARWSPKSEPTPDGTPPDSDRNATAMRPQSGGNALQTPDARHQETQEDKPPVLRARRAKTPRSKKCPPDFEVPESDRLAMAAEAPDWLDIDAETRAFRDHEYRDGRTDWPAAWRNWQREAIRRGPPRSSLRLAHAQQPGRLTRGEEVMAQSMPFESLAPHVQAVVRARRGAASADLPLVETIDAPVARITG